MTSVYHIMCIKPTSLQVEITIHTLLGDSRARPETGGYQGGPEWWDQLQWQVSNCDLSFLGFLWLRLLHDSQYELQQSMQNSVAPCPQISQSLSIAPVVYLYNFASFTPYSVYKGHGMSFMGWHSCSWDGDVIKTTFQEVFPLTTLTKMYSHANFFSPINYMGEK